MKKINLERFTFDETHAHLWLEGDPADCPPAMSLPLTLIINIAAHVLTQTAPPKGTMN